MRLILRHLRLMTTAAILIGGAAGWIASLTMDGTEATAQGAANGFPFLFLILPLALIGSAVISQDRAWKNLLPAGVLGGAAGVFMYWIAATLITGSVGGEDLNTIRDAILARIPVWQIGVAVGAALVGAGIAATRR